MEAEILKELCAALKAFNDSLEDYKLQLIQLKAKIEEVESMQPKK